MFSSFFIMSQFLPVATRSSGRLLHAWVTAALSLAAATGGVLLSGAEAQAASFCNASIPINPTQTVGAVTIASWVGAPATCVPPATASGIAVSTEIQNPSTARYDVDVDYQPDLTTPGSYVFEYTLTSTLGSFISAHLDSVGTDTQITKEIWASLPSGGTAPLYTLVSNSGMPSPTLPIAPMSTLYVRDTAVVNANGNLDNYRNTFQTPGPLPIVGAGAAFGFSRKLRSRIKAVSRA
ncbi:MAG: hypothetical protein VKO39_00265 [Cyanobacteriota bacterium]|nr:hypothetical protein [Cyanobacteriota bacterium]